MGIFRVYADDRVFTTQRQKMILLTMITRPACLMITMRDRIV